MGADCSEGGDLDIENFARSGEMIHGGKVISGARDGKWKL